MIAAIGNTLSYSQGLGLLVGIGIGVASNNARFTTWSEIGSELNILVTGGHLTQTQVVNALVTNQILGLTASYMTSSGLTFAQIGTDLATDVQGGQLTPTQALSVLGGFYSFSGVTTPLVNATITLATSLVNNGPITTTAAFAARSMTPTSRPSSASWRGRAPRPRARSPTTSISSTTAFSRPAVLAGLPGAARSPALSRAAFSPRSTASRCRPASRRRRERRTRTRRRATR